MSVELMQIRMFCRCRLQHLSFSISREMEQADAHQHRLESAYPVHKPLWSAESSKTPKESEVQEVRFFSEVEAQATPPT